MAPGTRGTVTCTRWAPRSRCLRPLPHNRQDLPNGASGARPPSRAVGETARRGSLLLRMASAQSERSERCRARAPKPAAVQLWLQSARLRFGRRRRRGGSPVVQMINCRCDFSPGLTNPQNCSHAYLFVSGNEFRFAPENSGALLPPPPPGPSVTFHFPLKADL